MCGWFLSQLLMSVRPLERSLAIVTSTSYELSLYFFSAKVTVACFLFFLLFTDPWLTARWQTWCTTFGRTCPWRISPWPCSSLPKTLTTSRFPVTFRPCPASCCSTWWTASAPSQSRRTAMGGTFWWECWRFVAQSFDEEKKKVSSRHVVVLYVG